MSEFHPMKRDTLRDIITHSAEVVGCAQEDVDRLTATADNIDIMLVGEYDATVEGKVCGCPATLAGYYSVEKRDFTADTPAEVKNFPEVFDEQFCLQSITMRWGKQAGDNRPETDYVVFEDRDFNEYVDFVRIED